MDGYVELRLRNISKSSIWAVHVNNFKPCVYSLKVTFFNSQIKKKEFNFQFFISYPEGKYFLEKLQELKYTLYTNIPA